MSDKPLVIESARIKQLPAATALQLGASAAAAASINIPHGAAPTSPNDGDVWTTSAGIFCRVNGLTVGPLAAATGGGGGSSSVGRLYSAYASVGTPASTAETTLQNYTMPGGTMATDGQVVRIRAAGTFAATTRSRAVRLYFGATNLQGVSTTASGNVVWIIDATIIRSGAAVQIAYTITYVGALGSTSTAMLFGRFTPAETLSGDVLIKATGQSSTGAAANDVVCDLLLVELI